MLIHQAGDVVGEDTTLRIEATLKNVLDAGSTMLIQFPASLFYE